MPIIHLSIRVELNKKGKSMKIDGENFDFTKKAQEIAKNEIVENSDKRQEILFNIFDKNKDSKLSQDEITETLNIFQALDKEDASTKKKDEELSDDEILAAMKKLEETNPEFKEGKFELKEVKEMMVKFLKLNKSKAEAAEAPSEASSAAPTEASASDEVKPSENPKDYVVPEGQSFKQLLNKILEKQGKTKPSKEDYKKAEEQFRKDNPDIEIRERRGIKYLLVGSRVKVPVDFGEELCDPEVEIEKWKVRVGLSKAKQNNSAQAAESNPEASASESAQSQGAKQKEVQTVRGDNKYSAKKFADGTIKYYDPDGNEISGNEFKNNCPNIYSNINRQTVKGANGYYMTMEVDGQKNYFDDKGNPIAGDAFREKCPTIHYNANKDRYVKGANGYYVYYDSNGKIKYYDDKHNEITAEQFKAKCPTIYANINKPKVEASVQNYAQNFLSIDENGRCYD